jgi:hypothetical protein
MSFTLPFQHLLIPENEVTDKVTSTFSLLPAFMCLSKIFIKIEDSLISKHAGLILFGNKLLK